MNACADAASPDTSARYTACAAFGETSRAVTEQVTRLFLLAEA